ncbi:MAG: conjugative transposon protein TraM [Candidatus Cyclobacteriaceae bacterium M3_2C_046]
MNSDLVVDQIHQYPVNLEVYDRDYSRGILLHPDQQNQADQSIYRSGYRTAADLPLELAQDVARSLLQQKKRKSMIVRINDGYPVYLL